MSDVEKISIGPYCSVEFIAGMCAALSDERGEVVAEIHAIKGKPVAKLKRYTIAADVPMFLRRQAE